MLTAIGEVMREAHKRGWITTRDGNISLRRGNSFYITPSGWRKSIIHPEHILKAKIEGDILNWVETHASKPSGELEMHRLLQVNDFKKGKTRSVVHLHPTYVIAAMYRGFDLQKLAQEFAEVSRYTKVGPMVGVVEATSKELARSTFSAATNEGKISYNLIGQANHGVCAIAEHPWEAFEHIERLEHICQIVLASGKGPE